MLTEGECDRIKILGTAKAQGRKYSAQDTSFTSATATLDKLSYSSKKKFIRSQTKSIIDAFTASFDVQINKNAAINFNSKLQVKWENF